jgi:hypothetical protein
MTHYTDIDLLIVKLPSAVHERAHGNLAEKLCLKAERMGIHEDELDYVGATRFHGRRSSKEGDSTYRPHSFRPNETNWPTIVIESGVSESLRRLRFDASWWLTESGGDVKIVIIISIQRVQNAQSRLQMEKWEHAPSRRLLPLKTPNNNPNNFIRQLPTKVQEITIVSNTIAGGPLPVTGGPFTITGGPLVGERTFQTLAQATEYLKQLTPEDRYRAVISQASKLIDLQEETDQRMAHILTFAQEDDAINDRMIPDPGTWQIWQKISDGAQRHGKIKHRKHQAVATVFERWGRENVERHFTHMMDRGFWSLTKYFSAQLYCQKPISHFIKRR